MSDGTLVGRNMGITPAVVDTAGMEDSMKKTLTQPNYEAPKRMSPGAKAAARPKASMFDPDTKAIDEEISRKNLINAGKRWAKSHGF